MKLLFIVSRIPYPLDKGDKLRAFHQLNYLAKYHEITLICLTDSKPHQEAFAFLKSRCTNLYFFRISLIGIVWRMVKALFNKKPFQVNYFFVPAIARKIDKIIEKNIPDFIGCQLIRTAPYVEKYDTINKFIDYMDCLSAGMYKRHQTSRGLMKLLSGIEYNRLVTYEKQVYQKFDFATIIANQDLELLPLKNKEKVYIIKNGVDFNYFKSTQTEKTIDILFTGNMAYPPNVDAAEYLITQILPLVYKKLPHVKVAICGINPDRRIKKLHSKQVLITGWVPDMRLWYNKSKVFVAPMRIGSGLQNKLLEAMAMQIPTITTPLANNALKAQHENQILEAKTETEIAKHIVTLLTNQNMYNKIKTNGHDFVKANFSWEKNTLLLNDLLQKKYSY